MANFDAYILRMLELGKRHIIFAISQTLCCMQGSILSCSMEACDIVPRSTRGITKCKACCKLMITISMTLLESNEVADPAMTAEGQWSSQEYCRCKMLILPI